MVLTRKYELLKPVNWRHRIILIVDDVIPNFKILEKALLPTQAKIEHAKIGFEGIRKCLENQKIDVVLIEINLSELSELELVNQYRVFRPDLVIIGHSAFVTTVTRQKCLEAGMDDFFNKPIDSKELIVIIGMALKKRDKKL
ncbi:MAG TPA: response regulator [Bacteroidales bacterium]|jgi:hypothetical protein|nr:response regulator [Bacteroidales bacterium]MBP7873395.1 response regulator [Bacteroidales bacterium]MCZ2282188.1 response regulator [Bacteroidales bacterium]HPX34386.1 response regulator [Bacteroidales bacterium]HQB47245.1 response regulator [Bacteroidales bacterium]